MGQVPGSSSPGASGCSSGGGGERGLLAGCRHAAKCAAVQGGCKLWACISHEWPHLMHVAGDGAAAKGGI